MKKTLLVILCFGLLMAALFGLSVLKERLMPQEEEAAEPEEVIDWANELDEAHATEILFAGDSITATGLGAAVNGSSVTIRYPGTYVIRGELADGQIVVDCDHDGSVYLILGGVNLRCSYGPALLVLQAQDTIVRLAEGTENYLADAAVYTQQLLDAQGAVEADQPDAAIFSRDDLRIEGAGGLTVVGYYHDAIHCKDDLVFAADNVALYAVNDGAKGTESLTVESGALYVAAQADGLQSSKGPIAMNGGELTIQSGGDGIAAFTELTISGGSASVTAAGGREYYSSIVMADLSAKALKAEDIAIRGGTLTLNCADDGVHAERSLLVEDVVLTIQSGDDALNAGETLEILGGEIEVLYSYEGLEAMTIALGGGSVSVWAENNGLAATLDILDTEHSGSDCGIRISGGLVSVTAAQAVKTDGAFTLSDGAAFLQGVSADDEALEALGGGVMQGGTLVVSGSMSAEPVTVEAGFGSLLHRLTTAAAGGTAIELKNEAGETCFQYAPSEDFGAFFVAYNGLVDGGSYQIAVGEQTASVVLGETQSAASGEPGGASGPMGGMRPF